MKSWNPITAGTSGMIMHRSWTYDPDETESWRSSFVNALGEMGYEWAIDPLFQIFWEDEGEHGDYVRSIAVKALGKIGTERVIGELIAALLSSYGDLRYWAAEALRETDDERAIEPLTKALEDEDERVRKSAAKALGEIKRKILKNNNPRI